MKKRPEEVMASYTIAELRETANGYFSYGCRSTLLQSPDAVKEQALRHIRYWVEQFQRMGASFDRTKTIHKMIDERITHVRSQSQGVQVSCKSGCANCCRTLVFVSEDEAKLIARRVKNGVKIDMEKLMRQASGNHNQDSWFKLPKSEGTCVFLGEDNNCRIYDNRPSTCRTYLVTTDPEICAPDDNGAPREVQYFSVMEAELLSTIESRLSPQGTLPTMLLKELQESKE